MTEPMTREEIEQFVADIGAIQDAVHIQKAMTGMAADHTPLDRGAVATWMLREMMIIKAIDDRQRWPSFAFRRGYEHLIHKFRIDLAKGAFDAAD